MAEEKKNVSPDAATEPPKEKPKAKRTTKTNKELDALREQNAALNDQYLRMLAEYDNYRKRTQKEKESSYGDGIVAAVKSFLPVIDNLERAIAAGEDSPFKEGLALIMTQISDTLACIGVKSVGEIGEPFDPAVHQAIMHLEDENLPENSIAAVLQKGYVYKDGVVIRPAAVQVAN